jgi:Flp pilus assembly protein TadG
MTVRGNWIKSVLKKGVSSLLRNTEGNMTITFALASIPLLIGIGAAVDASRISREDSTFHAAVDSACLAVAADDRSATSNGSVSAANLKALEDLAAEYIKTNYSPSRGYEGEPSVQVEVGDSFITTDAELDFPTTIMALAGVNSIQLKAHCKVAMAMRPIEVVMVMDTTGSMSGTKMTQSKAAAHKFLETVYGGSLATKPRSEYIRVAFVPFAASVRLNTSGSDYDVNWLDTNGNNPLSTMNFIDPTTGTNTSNTGVKWHNAMAWSQMYTSGTSRLAWSGCIEARAAGTASSGTDYNINDTPPDTTQPETLFPYYFAPDTYVPSSTGNDNDYIGSASGVTTAGTENYGFASNPSQTTTAGQKSRQTNLRKYINKTVGAERSTVYGPWNNCVVSSIVPMTYDRATVEASIDLMTAYGNTLLPEGLGWGLRALSPTQPLTKVAGSGTIAATVIAPYNGPRWQKIMVFMTDGENDVGGIGGNNPQTYNGTAYSAFGFGNQSPLTTNRYGVAATSTTAGKSNLDAFTTSLCTRIKNNNITLYVVGFSVPSASKALLQNCATQTTAPYYQDGTTANITTLFDHIGKDVLNKMVYIKE